MLMRVGAFFSTRHCRPATTAPAQVPQSVVRLGSTAEHAIYPTASLINTPELPKRYYNHPLTTSESPHYCVRLAGGWAYALQDYRGKLPDDQKQQMIRLLTPEEVAKLMRAGGFGHVETVAMVRNAYYCLMYAGHLRIYRDGSTLRYVELPLAKRNPLIFNQTQTTQTLINLARHLNEHCNEGEQLPQTSALTDALKASRDYLQRAWIILDYLGAVSIRQDDTKPDAYHLRTLVSKEPLRRLLTAEILTKLDA